MGVYLNVVGMQRTGKADWLIENAGAREVDVLGFEVQAGEVLICVVTNMHRGGAFDAAAIMFDADELHQWLEPEYVDFRPKRWLAMDRARAFVLAGADDPQLEA